MKKLIRRLSRVADSSQYCPLPHDQPAPARSCRFDVFRTGKIGRSRVRSVAVPDGHIPVYVGEEMERFVVSAELLNHPIFVKLLNKSAQEYGYEQKGVLHIPCHVLVFERVLEALRVGDDSVQDLLNSLSDDFL
ncbi:SAUR-like auxin-responsive protein family [Actinidia rufa]|uniref:SAUR-like auxin-responsive protein family n=1 Tax=Actinidia rufa TaxID=165716 RepID=A0A7J0G959_9ERIC|nr:SAUR-like auxin-responsive protein family [Actinidia rufa]